MKNAAAKIRGATRQDATPQIREDFYRELRALQERFAAMKPERETLIRDPAIGLEGFLVIWNTGIGENSPLGRVAKGGTRITPTLSFDEVKKLAKAMALRNAAAGLPLGGAKSGLRADPDAPGFEEKYRRFVQLCRPALHENGGLYGGFGFDLGTRREHVLWACDELKSTRSFTGKPRAMGGTDYDREGLAGLGVALAAQSMLAETGVAPAQASYAVQGLGALGAGVLRYFGESGARLAALSDPKYGGTWKFTAPLSLALQKALIERDDETARALLPGEGVLLSDSPNDVLYAAVDVLFPCAVQNVITESKSDRIKARIIIEGAHNPVTEEARTALYRRGVVVVPDFIANPGAIIAAWVEMASPAPDKVAEAQKQIGARIAANIREMQTIARTFGVEPAHAGLFMALKRIFCVS